MKYLITFLLVSFLATLCHAQAPVQGSSQEVRMAPASTTLDSNTLPAMTNKAFNTDSDSVDFEEGLLHWKGRTFNLGNNRVMRARFERYLSSPDANENELAYSQVLKEIEQRLSLINENNEAKTSEKANTELFEAWKLLFKAGEFPVDNGSSLIIANLVNNAWRVRNEGKTAAVYNDELKRQVTNLQNRVLQGAFWDESKAKRYVEDTKDGKTPAPPVSPNRVTQAVYDTEQLAEVKASIAALNTQTASTGIQLKLQFQSQILQFLLQRRYQHTIMGAAFYGHLFKGSQQGLVVGEKQLAEFLPDSNMKPTVNLLEFMAREAIRDVGIGMDTVRNTYANGDLYASLERLQETYFLGEYMPNVVQFSSEKKMNLLTLFRQTRELQKLMDFKDYNGAESVVQDVQKRASDFQASPIITIINTAKRSSNLAVLKAKQAIGIGQFDKAEQAIMEATKLWPLNPEIMQFSEKLATQSDMSNQGSRIFDEYFASGDYRKIFDKRSEFAAAVMKDPLRSAQLKDAVDKISQVEFLLAQIREALTQNNPYFAWEMILQAESVYPNDLELQRSKADVSVRASKYAQLLADAERAYTQGNQPLALLRYLDAKQIYPASKTSRIGLEKSAQALLKNATESRL